MLRELIRLGGLEAASFRKHQDAIAKTLDCTPRSVYELYIKIQRETRDDAPITSSKRKAGLVTGANAESDGTKPPSKKQAKVAAPKKAKANAKAAEADDGEETAIDQQDQGADAIKDE